MPASPPSPSLAMVVGTVEICLQRAARGAADYALHRGEGGAVGLRDRVEVSADGAED